MPASACSAMWQWAIHVPGLVMSTRMSTVSPRSHEHGVLPREVGVRLPVAVQHKKTFPVHVEWMRHRVIRVGAVDRWIFTRSPILKVHVMSWFTAPVSRSTSFQET